MIRDWPMPAIETLSKPRASGDDPLSIANILQTIK